MANLPSVFPGYIQVEETQFKAAVSEYTAQRMGQMFNFLVDKEHQEKQFFINGPYTRVVLPILGVDGLTVFSFNAEIFNVYIFNHVAGSSGVTELDLKISPNVGASFSSIFSTTPKIDSTAVSESWLGIGDVLMGCTAPVLTSGASPFQVTAGSALRCDVLQTMTGAQNCGLVVHYRPK